MFKTTELNLTDWFYFVNHTGAYKVKVIKINEDSTVDIQYESKRIKRKVSKYKIHKIDI